MAQAPLREVPAHFLRGMAMGSADIVPGVSGGTVALVLAIYHRLVTADPQRVLGPGPLPRSWTSAAAWRCCGRWTGCSLSRCSWGS